MAHDAQQRDVHQSDGQQRMDAYLGKLRQRLRGMNDEDAREIVQELRSHIRDKATVSGQLTAAEVDAALAALGSSGGVSQPVYHRRSAGAGGGQPVAGADPGEFVPLGQPQRSWVFRVADLHRRIFPRGCFRSRGRVEAISSRERRIVGSSEWRRRP